MNITEAITALDSSGYVHLRITFDDGRKASLDAEVCGHLQRGHGVFLGPEWERDIATYAPPDDANGRCEMILKGFTKDPSVIAVAERFRDMILAGKIEPGTRLL